MIRFGPYRIFRLAELHDCREGSRSDESIEVLQRLLVLHLLNVTVLQTLLITLIIF